MSYADKFTITQLKTERYSDFYPNFNKNFGTKDLARQTNEDSVIGSIRNILFTNKGERVYNPEFGSNLTKLLFENFSVFTAQSAKNDIVTAIENFEPRVKNVRVFVEEDDDNHSLKITLIFTLLNNSRELSTTFLLSRIR